MAIRNNKESGQRQLGRDNTRKRFSMATTFIEGKSTITERVPEGKTVQDWQELMIIQNLAGTPGTPTDFLEQLKAIRE